MLIGSAISQYSTHAKALKFSKEMEIIGKALGETTCKDAIIEHLEGPAYRINIRDGKPGVVGGSNLYGFKVYCSDGRVGFATHADMPIQAITFFPK